MKEVLQTYVLMGRVTVAHICEEFATRYTIEHGSLADTP